MVRVTLPYHLRTLAGTGAEITIELEDAATPCAILDALETRYPMLAGTIRDHTTKQRRAYLRFFACSEDISHDPLDTPLPDAIVKGMEPFMIVGAIAGG